MASGRFDGCWTSGGGQELLAFTLVGVEQTAQDGGKWEVGWLLCFCVEATKSRLRAFRSSGVGHHGLGVCQGRDVTQSRCQEVVPPRKPEGGGQKDEKDGLKKTTRGCVGHRDLAVTATDIMDHVGCKLCWRAAFALAMLIRSCAIDFKSRIRAPS